MHTRKTFRGTRLWLLLGAAAAVALAPPVSAQQRASSGRSHAVVPQQSVHLPVETVLRLSVPRAGVTSPAPVLLPQQRPRATNVTLMIVGGAGLVVGSLIDGDTGTIVMVGSGIVGLVGLYRYLQ